jgi:O-antigen/teichoic acid export membrane protein
MIYAIYSPYISGQFGLVERSLTIPMAMVVTAVSQVYMAGLADAIRTPGQSGLLQYRKVVRNLTLLGLLPMAVLMAFGPFLFQTLFGERWALAGQFAQIMAPAYVLLLASGGVNMTLLVLGRQKLQFAWEIGRLIVLVGIWVVIPVLGLSEITAVILYTIMSLATSAAFIVMADLALRAHGRSEASADAEAEAEAAIAGQS